MIIIEGSTHTAMITPMTWQRRISSFLPRPGIYVAVGHPLSGVTSVDCHTNFPGWWWRCVTAHCMVSCHLIQAHHSSAACPHPAPAWPVVEVDMSVELRMNWSWSLSTLLTSTALYLYHHSCLLLTSVTDHCSILSCLSLVTELRVSGLHSSPASPVLSASQPRPAWLGPPLTVSGVQRPSSYHLETLFGLAPSHGVIISDHPVIILRHCLVWKTN